ncbi:MIA40 [Candida oxycetoniae]|uniref:Mitochondrial intermembrane space import and assembly protein 40 n=1 Tax=Candida oxycetoniae TaxID=497107 RepID=A0AAI9SVP1_9ASCO|nr:MIA40 [Candida oxycetoniae]KAI3403933.2 MIA40 [Candida oxycetoniae]
MHKLQIRNYSESASSEKQPPPISRFEATKHYIKQVHIEGSDEANTVLGYLRRAGALSVLVMFASIGYAVYVEKSNKPKEIEEIEIEEYMPKLGEDVRPIIRSTVARQTRARIARCYSSNASTQSTKTFLNSRLIVGGSIVGSIAIAYGYLASNQSFSIQNETARNIRDNFTNGDAMADQQQKKLKDQQQKLKNNKTDKEIEDAEKSKKENVQEASGTDTKNISSDSEIRDAKSNESVEKSSKHSGGIYKRNEESASNKETLTSIEQSEKHGEGEGEGEKKEEGEGEGEGEGEKEGDKDASTGEEKQEAAYNPETGEINWDCPCLGGMAHGPCGEEFKEAFSCFVFSETEPKGIDCIKKFENMRSCFKQHPDHYKEELYYDDDDKELDTEGVEHATLESAEPAVQEIETGIEEGKLKPKEK